MNFTDQLYSLPIERLKEIVRNRAYQIRSVPRIASKRDLCAWLAQILSDAYAVRRAFEETDLLQARLLSFIVAQGGDMPLEVIVEQFGEPARNRIAKAADGLEALGLAIRRPSGESDSWRLWTPDAVRRSIPLPLPVRHKLCPTLERYDAPALNHIVNFLNLASPGLNAKQARAAAIANKLLHEDSLEDLLASVSEEAQKLLELVLRRGGVTSLHELGLQLDTRRRNQLYSYDWSYRWHQTAPRNPVEELLSAGLLVMEGSVGFQYGAILVAGDLLEKLTGQSILTGDIPSEPEWQTVPPEGQAVRTFGSLGRDIAYLMGYLARNPTGRTSKGIIHRTALKNIAKSMTAPNAFYATFVYSVSREAGLIDVAGAGDSYGLSPEGEAWLKNGRDEQLQVLHQAWMRQRTWVEGAPDLLIDETVFVDSDAVQSVRETVVALLGDFARGNPVDLITLQSLAAYARYRRWADFPADAEREAEPAATTAGDLDDYDRPSEKLTAGDLVERVVWALFYLGLVEVVSSQSGTPALVRLTPLGRGAFIGEPYPDQTQEVTTFVVQPNLEIYTPPNLTAEHYYGLFRIADPKGSGMLALSKESLRKALDRGATTSEIVEFLKEHSSSGLPQNVEYLVREVGGKHGHIRVGHAGLYLVVDDPILLKEIAAQSKLTIRVRKQLADSVALITGDSVDAVLKQLRQIGYLPVADKDDKPAAKRGTSRRRPASSPAADSAAHVLASIHWNKLTDDTPRPGQPVGITDPLAIRRLLIGAIKSRRRVQYSSDQNPQDSDIVIIEPVGLAGSLLRVFVPDRGHFGIINLSQIRWAAATGEIFEPKPEPAHLRPQGK